jgi:exodeoxyribonuclease V beta subunit
MELFYIASAAAEPGNQRALKAAVSTDLFGIRSGDFASLNTGTGTSRFRSFDEISARFFYYRETWHNSGIMSMLRELLAMERVEERLFSLPEGERRITNIYHLIELLHRAEKSRDLAVSGLLGWFRSSIMEKPLDDEYLTRLERDDFAVKILTVHSSKGLEFPVVFSPLIPEGDSSIRGPMIYHDRGDSNRTVMYLDNSAASDDEKELYRRENFAENVRLIYVALTRAKSKCFVYTAKTVKNFTSSTPFALFYKLRNDIGEKTDNPGFNEYKEAMEKISGFSQGCIYFQVSNKISGKAPVSVMDNINLPKLSARTFKGRIKDDWRVWSYSSLVSGYEYEGRDRDRDASPYPEMIIPDSDSIFTFPSGAKPGLFIHDIFENIDFTWPSENIREIITGRLARYGFEEKWAGSIEEMIKNVLSADIDSRGLRLSTIDSDKRLNELEFHFPVKSLSVDELKHIFISRGSNSSGAARGISGFSSLRGFLKGFIDMIFLYNGKYYITDWKSNNLGPGYEFYTQERIVEEMGNHNYFLQYHLYSLALHRYLKTRIGGDYDFDRDFGGVYYLFVRGINSEFPGSGVFYDRPEKRLIEELDLFFRAGD